MNWFLIALVAPALWSVTNYIDKFLISKYFKGGGVGSLIIFSSLIGFFVFPLIYVFRPDVFGISFIQKLLLIVNGFIYVLAMLPYIYALNKDEASIVVPLFQTIPVFSYILGLVVLGEVLTFLQILAGALVLTGAIILSLDLTENESKFKKEVFWLMLLASFLISLNSLIFKFVAIDTDFWTTSFWEYVGFGVFAIFLLVFVKSYREEFQRVIQVNKVPVIGLNGFNEIINIIAKFAMNFATLLAPLALVWVVNGFQPFFVFVYGVILTIFFPHIVSEDLTKRHVLHKLTAILIMFIGTYFLNTA